MTTKISRRTEKPLHVMVAEVLGFSTDPAPHEYDEASGGCKACTRCLALAVADRRPKP